MKYVYVEHCAKGYVQFTNGNETVVMPKGEPVEVPDWLARKFGPDGNSHFHPVHEDAREAETPLETETPLSAPERRRPGRPPKPRLPE